MEQYIKRHQKKYPKMELIDLYKLIYQSFYLTGHFITDSSKSYLENEYAKTQIENDLLYEYISEDAIRVNINPFCTLYGVNTLFDMFKNSNIIKHTDFVMYLTSLGLECLNELIMMYIKIGCPSHSPIYREEYHPAYRLVLANYLTFDMRRTNLKRFIDKKRGNGLKIICLEGRCCSGKTTLANSLDDVCIIKCDDHFKDPIDYDYLENLLSKLKPNNEFSETIYNCHTNSYKTVKKKVNEIVILEGSYGYHERLLKYFNSIIYVNSSENQRLQRLKNRESKESYQIFINKWLVREKEFYSNSDLISICDLII